MFTAVGQSTAILFDMTASDTTPVSQMVNQRWAPKGDDDFITRAHKQRMGSKYRWRKDWRTKARLCVLQDDI